MKIEILYQNTKLKTEVKKDLKIKDLLQDIKYYLNIKEKNFALYDFNNIKLKETDIIPFSKKKDKVTLYLINSSKNENILQKNLKNLNEKININNLIMKCTGAKKPLEKKIPQIRRNRDVIHFFDNNGLDIFLDMIQGFAEMNRNPNINNSGPVEANEHYLNELKSMGFPEDRAREALISSRNNINRATEILLGDGGE